MKFFFITLWQASHIPLFVTVGASGPDGEPRHGGQTVELAGVRDQLLRHHPQENRTGKYLLKLVRDGKFSVSFLLLKHRRLRISCC
jgi:hypothetical protein